MVSKHQTCNCGQLNAHRVRALQLQHGQGDWQRHDHMAMCCLASAVQAQQQAAALGLRCTALPSACSLPCPHLSVLAGLAGLGQLQLLLQLLRSCKRKR